MPQNKGVFPKPGTEVRVQFAMLDRRLDCTESVELKVSEPSEVPDLWTHLTVRLENLAEDGGNLHLLSWK